MRALVFVGLSLTSLILTIYSASLAGPKLLPKPGLTAYSAIQFGKSYLRQSPPDAAGAARYFKRAEVIATETGEAWPIMDLADMHRKGDGVPRNMKEAVRLYQTIADRSPWAKYQLGLAMSEGRGTPRDPAAARILLEEAARETGDQWPKLGLAKLLESTGSPTDLDRAYALYRETARAGNKEAAARLKRLCSDPAKPGC
jgi:TPR repeat protein